MIPKSGYRFPACAKPRPPNFVGLDASAGEARSDKDHAQTMSEETDSTQLNQSLSLGESGSARGNRCLEVTLQQIWRCGPGLRRYPLAAGHLSSGMKVPRRRQEKSKKSPAWAVVSEGGFPAKSRTSSRSFRRPPGIGHELCTNLTVRCHLLDTVKACHTARGLGSPHGGATMTSVLKEIVLLSSMGALFLGIMLTAAASLVG
jgi:hypothetical protein